MLLPTTLVGSYPQPEWLIDRANLAGRFPPRVRAQELWRVPAQFLAEAQDDATILAIRAQEQAGIDIITDGEIRRESYSNRFATALEGVDLDNPGYGARPLRSSQSGAAHRRQDPPHALGRGRGPEIPATPHRPARSRSPCPGPFTMAQQAQNDFYAHDADAAMDYAAAVNEEIKDLFAAGADVVQIDEPYLQARPEKAARIRPARAESRARGRDRDDRRAHLLRLCRDHSRAPERLFVPVGAQGLPLQAGLHRDGAVEPRLLGAQGPAGQDDHGRRARPLDDTRSRRRRPSPRASAARLPTASPRTSSSPPIAASSTCRARSPSAR